MTAITVLKKFVLLISLIISPLVVIASEDEIWFNYSGFVYNTTFSDNTFHNNRNVVALNADIDYMNVAFRTQVSIHDSLPIRRAVFEFSNIISEKVEYVYQIGRFSRVNSFYNAVLNPPADYQMAMLPLAGYSYRMFNGSFVLMDGHNFMTTYKMDNGNLIRARIATGRGVINDQENVQREVIGKYDQNLRVETDRNNYDYGLHYDTKEWSLFWSRNDYSTNIGTNSNLKPYKQFEYFYNGAEYHLEKFGVRYDNQKWVISGEYGKGVTKSFSKADLKTSQSMSEDYHIIIGNRITENIYLYSGYSVGFNHTSKTKNFDSFIGTTYNFSPFVMSFEYHSGKGRGWVKYSDTSSEKTWNSWVISTSYRF